MFIALDENKEKILATKNSKGKCPFCGMTVIACTGEIKNWYWRHETQAKSDCLASTYENEGAWHNTWKHLFGKEFSEIYCSNLNEKRIADVKLQNGLVIEIQHSNISTDIIRSRERFHKKLIWVFDASGAEADGRLRVEENFYHWIQPRLSLTSCTCPIFLDVGFGNVFEIREIIIEKFRGEKWERYTKTGYKGKEKMYKREDWKNKMLYADKALSNFNYLKPFKSQFENMKSSTQLSLFDFQKL